MRNIVKICFAVFLYAAITASLLFFGLGTALYVFYVSRPGELPTAEQNDIIVPWFIATQLPAGLILLLVGLFGSTLTGVFLLGVLTKRAHARGVVIGIVASMTTLIVLRTLASHTVPGILTSAVGVLTCVAVGYLASLVLSGPKRSLGNLTIHSLEKRGT
jgi:Na+/proline symporter